MPSWHVLGFLRSLMVSSLSGTALDHFKPHLAWKYTWDTYFSVQDETFHIPSELHLMQPHSVAILY